MPSILITGASAGIGAETARQAAANGFDVGLNYRADHDGATAVAHAVHALGQRAVLLQGDVRHEQNVQQIFAGHIAQLGTPTLVVNNAGIVPPRARTVAKATASELRDVVEINIIGAFFVAQEAARALSAVGKGTLINISSAAARLGAAGRYVDYAMSKGAIDTLTTGLALELAEHGVRVVGLRPGIIETDIHGKGGDPDRATRVGHELPLKRAGTVAEIAQAILWIGSDQASYITGTTIDVSGGR